MSLMCHIEYEITHGTEAVADGRKFSAVKRLRRRPQPVEKRNVFTYPTCVYGASVER